MDFITICWLFAFAVIVHNLEEIIWLPHWLQKKELKRSSNFAYQFRFAATFLSLLLLLLVMAMTVYVNEVVIHYIVSGYALAMGLNFIFPHLLLSISTNAYMPGLASSALLVLPSSISLIIVAIEEAYINVQTFIWLGPIIALIILASIPILFYVAKRLYFVHAD